MYDGEWSKNDPRWTDNLVAQVPFGLDPRVEADKDGIFITPLESIFSDSGCLDGGIGIVHLRDDEGYTDDWFDAIDMDEEEHRFTFSVPADANINKDGAFWDSIYINIESYYDGTISV